MPPPTYTPSAVQGQGLSAVKQELLPTQATLCNTNPSERRSGLPASGLKDTPSPSMLQLLGEEQFLRVRSLMMAQQRTFVQQVNSRPWYTQGFLAGQRVCLSAAGGRCCR